MSPLSPLRTGLCVLGLVTSGLAAADVVTYTDYMVGPAIFTLPPQFQAR